jgi:Acetyltransferase (GNAT) domain
MKFFQSDLSNIHELAELARSAYDTGEIIDEDYLKWEYRDNPDGKALVYLAGDERKIMSQYIVLPRRYVLEQERRTGSISLNTITHPGYRGKGYFTQLAELTYSECINKQIEFTIGFPNKNSVKGFIGKLKFTLIGSLPLMLKVNNPFKAFSSFVFRRNMEDDDFKIDLRIPGVTELDLKTDLDAYSVFWKEFIKRNIFTTDRSPEFINWRYVQIPIRKYHLYKVVTNEKIESVIVLRTKRIFGVRCAIVVDLLTLSKNEITVELIRKFGKTSADLMISTVPIDSLESESLKSAGFFQIPEILMLKKLYFILRIHSRNISGNVTEFKKWFITFGDYDIF